MRQGASAHSQVGAFSGTAAKHSCGIPVMNVTNRCGTLLASLLSFWSCTISCICQQANTTEVDASLQWLYRACLVVICIGHQCPEISCGLAGLAAMHFQAYCSYSIAPITFTSLGTMQLDTDRAAFPLWLCCLPQDAGGVSAGGLQGQLEHRRGKGPSSNVHSNLFFYRHHGKPSRIPTVQLHANLA